MRLLFVGGILLSVLCGSTISSAPSNDNAAKSMPPVPAPKNTLNSVPNKHMLRPYFEDVGSRNLTAVVGQVVILKCRVKQLGERTVSWMRKRDLHILTTNIYTYTGDARFSVIHPQNSDEWNMKIDYAQNRDAGIYECQVNTEPKMNMAIMLNVDDAQATIQGHTEQHVKAGSTISLVCSVNVHSTPPGNVLWFQDTNKIDFDSPRGGISLETEKTEKGTTSKLLVTKATLTDSGNYTCIPSNASPASVYVHVLNGEHPAAMQHGGVSSLVAWGVTLVLATSLTTLRWL